MFKAEPMRRVLVAVPRTRTGAVVGALHDLRALHIRDQREGCDGLGLCPPLDGASEASETLIRIRAMMSALGISGQRPMAPRPASEVMAEVERRLPEVEREVNALIEERVQKEGESRALEQRLEALAPFVALGLPLELYRPYDSLWVLVGTVPKDPAAALDGAHIGHELFRPRGRAHAGLVALFVDEDQSDEVQAIMVREGFSSIAIQEGEGDPGRLCDGIRADREGLDRSIEGVEERLARIRDAAWDVLVAAEEHLSIEVEQLESPLRFGGTANSTIIEGWVPVPRMGDLVRALDGAAGEAYHLEVLEDEVAGGHGLAGARVANDDGEPVADGAGGAGDPRAPAGGDEGQVEPPVLLNNPPIVAPYEMLVTEVATPSYREMDPSAFMVLTFPLFFGMMMGDIAYGALTAVGGFIVYRRSRNASIRKVAQMLAISGAASIAFGSIYGEAFGFPLYGHPHGLLWAHDLYMPALGLFLPIDRFEEAMLLIRVCLYIGIAHLMLGLSIGLYNERVSHGTLHAFLSKGSWMMILLGGFVVVSLSLKGAGGMGDPLFVTGAVVLLGGLVALMAGEGPVGLLHVPNLLSNVLSYIRIFALGLSGAGIAITFNSIAAPAWSSGTAMGYIGALLIGAMGHLLNIFLSILGPTMHSLRLHYVEWMTKFYTGGGVAYRPFGRTRRYTEV